MLPVFPTLLFTATLCFALGIVLPLIGVERLFVFTGEPSLLAMISGLWTEGDRALAAIVALFSVIFPAVKLLVLHMAAYGDKAGHIPRWFGALSKWSMLDVVLVALVIFAAKTSGLATAFTKAGLWFFAASAVLTAIASGMAKRQSPVVSEHLD